MEETSDPLEILEAIDRERGESLIGMIQANQVQRIRDEIVALRASLERHDRLVVTAVVVATPAIRAEALEEAAGIAESDEFCDPVTGWGDAGERIAAAIRGLKEKRDG